MKAYTDLADEMLLAAKMYYVRKCTLKIQKIVDLKEYENDSTLHEGVLYHAGRTLSNQEVDGKTSLGNTSLNLTASTFGGFSFLD